MASGVAQSNGGMDTFQPPVTPARRPGAGGSGTTPPAKRPSARPHFEEPAGIGLMTHEELVKEVCRLRKKYEQDVAWHNENTSVVVDHAKKFDQ